ncbi:MAG: DUF58 domain-containing protein [Planctomycetaceae bacterium]|nr:DUF58 domain-containing protein [Planctomycetaceae bacterium]MBT4843821.1 DUF58 domain-containing protein [Planctomycetaceae bacterium]MBT5125628.1 DUF58 domain-containing protein [Planctomycetaceae bacterium]MBT5884872.1 DUF58 domain-containing protein [Planctomycetaceae bacterium]MBT6846916.1 DUF58 domain-containing protein [Planctomycetaceae bacterium]
MQVKPRILITTQGWYYLFVVLFIVGGAIMREVNMLVILSGMLFGPLLLHWRLTISSLENLSFRRKFNNPTMAGVETRMEILLENHHRRWGVWFVQLHDRIRKVNQDSPADASEIQLAVPYIFGRSVARIPFTWDIAQRGIYEMGPLYIESRFPFGLIRARRTLRERESIIVCPQLGKLTPQWRRVIESDHHGLSGSFSRQGRSEGDYYAMRQWRSGDSTRWIHWRTTARLGELMVRQYEQQRDRAVGIVLDLSEFSAEAKNADSNKKNHHAVVMEIAVSMVATIVNDLCSRNGSYFSLTIAGTNASHFSATPSQNVTRTVLESLAVVNPGNGEALHDSFQWLSHEGQQGMTVVIVSTRSKQQAIAQLDQVSNSATSVTQQGWSLQDALWIDCQNHLEVDRFFQPFETTNATPTEQNDEQDDPLKQLKTPNAEAEMSLTTEEASH